MASSINIPKNFAHLGKNYLHLLDLYPAVI
jgi:hypothetical protein